MSKASLGYHLAIDLFQCQKNLLSDNDAVVLTPLKASIELAGMTVVGQVFKLFENRSWSACILLAESHVSVHTWPDEAYVSADVFVCNYSRDNTHGADQVGEFLQAYFEADVSTYNTLHRGGSVGKHG